MELIFASFALITFSLFLSFLNGIASEADLDTIETTIGKIENKYPEMPDTKILVTTSFLFFELLFYFISAFFLSIYFTFLSVILLNSLIYLIFFVLMVFVFLLRTALYFLGIRFSSKLIYQFHKPIYFLFAIFRFSGIFYHWLQKNISAREEEATLEDIQEVVETAHDEGTIQTGEYKIFTNVIKFNQVPVMDVMTPRIVIFACNAEMTVEEAIKLPEIKIYSRFPIFEGNSLDDKVVGYVVSKDIFQAALNNKFEMKLKEFARDIFFIPENVTLDDALNQFLSKRQHIFLVVDEFGGIEGLLTMEDLIETILGEEIIDEADKYIDLREVAKRKREIRMKMLQDGQQSNNGIPL